MGTEILPVFLTIAKILLGLVGLFAAFTIGAAMLGHRQAENDEVRNEMKGHVVNSLIAIVITLIIYLLISAIGPVFGALF